MTDKEERWMSFNICWYIFQQAGMIKEQSDILSWYEWSGFYIGHLCKIHFTNINDKSLSVLTLCLLVAIYFDKYWKVFNIFPYLSLLDNAERKFRPFWKWQKHLCKIHFTHINSRSLSVLFVSIYFNKYWKVFNILPYLSLFDNAGRKLVPF